MQRRNKFQAVERQVDALHFESTLLVESTSADDYGQYECVVRNALGQASTSLEFSKPSRPDTPLQLRVGNVSDSSVELLWTPGFDGGMQVYYRIRLKQHGEDKYKYVDAKPGEQNVTLEGLKPGGNYYFSVMAHNEAGGSKFLPDIKLTLSKGSQPHSAEYTEKDELPNVMIIGITSAAMVLLVLNAALVAWFVIRRQNKSQGEAEPSNDDAYSKDDNQSVYKVRLRRLTRNSNPRELMLTDLILTSYPSLHCRRTCRRRQQPPRTSSRTWTSFSRPHTRPSTRRAPCVRPPIRCVIPISRAPCPIPSGTVNATAPQG